MSYVVFARKYRPQAFDEVVGQSHITTTLKNAISQNRVAHAYIFAGPRGVGKTTTARILAKALNCERGPTDNPCNKCVSCNEITSGISLDILEIDGASNRGIDEIRNLRENVKFSPSKGRFKVYIIDEVHILTQEAFNALLKTLEEPPAHVKFIFATTQAYKVPPMILSRCQRFDFRRISTKDMVHSLKAIAKKELIEVDDDVLILIAKHSDGSMRDSQVVLDQISSFTGGKVAMEDASKVLGAVGDDVLFSLADSIKERDAVKALKIIEKLSDDGKDMAQVILYLVEHFRNLSVLKVSKDPSGLIDASDEKIRRYGEQARKFTTEEMLYTIYTFSGALDFTRKSGMSRTPFEVAFIKLTRAGGIAASGELLERLQRLEKSLEGRELSGPSLRATGGSEAISDSEIASAVSRPRNDKKHPAQPASKGQAIDEIVSAWPAVLNCIKDHKISVAMYLKEGLPLELEHEKLSIDFPKSSQFHKEMLESAECKSLISRAVKDICGLDVRIKFTVSENGSGNGNTAKDAFEGSLEGAAGGGREPKGEANEPIINEALEIFGGEIEERKNKR